MGEWQPIETYDKLSLKNRPEFAVFYVEAASDTHFSLGATVAHTRNYGSRNVTHWMPLPPPPEQT